MRDRHQQAALPSYRGDIDGLRAIAVLSVVLYHFGIPLQGGFVGVDVFFVISGFLIGGLLWREYTEHGSIRIGAFYLRRFRRLAPAFFAMLLATTAAGYLLLLPFEYREFGKSAVAATTYLSNVLFWLQTGYFDAAAHDKPLLHTWSLAVEEQFYILLPLVFVLLARRPRALLIALVAAFVLSIAACILVTPLSPSSAFFLFPFRAWEMLSGVLLAIAGQMRGASWQGWRAFSWLGLGLLVLSVVVIPAGDYFPGVLAILPVLATLLLLANGRNAGTVNRLLSTRPMRIVGLMSYSLYLWHWPVFVLSSGLRDGYANLFEAAGWIALSFGLAWLSWRYVELPVRRAERLPGWALAGGVALASTAVVAGGLFLKQQDGLPDRFDAAARVHIDASADFLQDFSRCSVAETLPLDGLEVCHLGPDGAPRVLVWGDSHVRAVYEGLAEAAAAAQVPTMVIWRAGCPPLFDVRKVESAATPAQDVACRQANLQIRQGLGRFPTLERALLVGRWGYYVDGQGTGFDAGNRIALYPTDRPERVDETQAEVFDAAARVTVEALHRSIPEVFVLRQSPEFPAYDSRRAARETAHARLPLAARPQVRTEEPRAALLADRANRADAPWFSLMQQGAIRLIDPWGAFCDAVTCSALQGGVGQYFDNNHLTNSAARRISPLLGQLYRGMAPSTEAMHLGSTEGDTG